MLKWVIFLIYEYGNYSCLAFPGWTGKSSIQSVTFVVFIFKMLNKYFYKFVMSFPVFHVRLPIISNNLADKNGQCQYGILNYVYQTFRRNLKSSSDGNPYIVIHIMFFALTCPILFLSNLRRVIIEQFV